MSDRLEPGDVIGILGGGQLGRMLALAAARLGLRTHIYAPPGDCPAKDVSFAETTAQYDDAAALEAFAKSVNVVTYEFENVPLSAIDAIGGIAPVRPGRRALAVSQDRLEEKDFLSDLDLKTARYAVADTMGDLAAALGTTGTPAILKTRRFGYDGKGQVRIDDPLRAEAALTSLNGAPAILEAVVPFEREISVIAARGVDGAISAYDPGENVHEGGILRTTTVPGDISEPLAFEAGAIAKRILEALDYVGVIGVELFELPEGGLAVNEFAPRVHNSGHWTQNGALTCQFEQHIRAVAGWPLGGVHRHSDIEMNNLIGTDMSRLSELLGSDVALHIYGKSEVRDGRKMGHVNRILRRSA